MAHVELSIIGSKSIEKSYMAGTQGDCVFVCGFGFMNKENEIIIIKKRESNNGKRGQITVLFNNITES